MGKYERREKFLKEISKRVSSKHKKGRLKEKAKYGKALRKNIEEASVNKNVPDHIRENAKRLVESGAIYEKKEVVDKKKAKQYEKAVEHEVNQAIKRGEIDAPTQEEKDKFKKGEL